MSQVRHEGLRFLIAGSLNTTATYGIYLLLLPVLRYEIAYSIAYVLGIGLAYLLNVWYVFRVRHSTRKLTLFPLAYFVQYLLGILVLRFTVETMGVPRAFALLFSLTITVPIVFLLIRYILKSSPDRLPPAADGH